MSEETVAEEIAGGSPVSVEETAEFIKRVMRESGGALPKPDVEAAYQKFVDMTIDAALVEGWRRGLFEFAWRDGDFRVRRAG